MVEKEPYQMGKLFFAGPLEVVAGDSLESLAPLQNLTAVGGGLRFASLERLNSLQGLESLDSVGGDLTLWNLPGITNLADLNNLRAVEGGFALDRTGISNLAELENLTYIGGGLSLEDNDQLTTLDGIGQLAYLGGLGLDNNDALTDITALEQITSLKGGLSIWGNEALSSLEGLQNVTETGSVQIIRNASLSGLESVGGYLHIDDNFRLASLAALSNLTTIRGYLQISQLDALPNLEGLENIGPGTITELILTNSRNLSVCGVQSICDYLANPDNPATISGNAPDCGSREEVEEACVAGSTGQAEENLVKFFPNPTTGFVQVAGLPLETASDTVADSRGRIVMNIRTAPGAIDLNGLPAGIYAIRIQMGRGVMARRVMKLD